MRLWVGMREDLGIIVFDPGQQSDVTTDRVRLWRLATGRMHVYDKIAVKRGLVALRTDARAREVPREAYATQLKAVLNEYRGWVSRAGPSARHAEGGPREGSDELPWLNSDRSDTEWRLIVEEMAEDADSWAASREEGWFYDEGAEERRGDALGWDDHDDHNA